MDSVEPKMDPALFSLNSRDILSIEVTAYRDSATRFPLQGFTFIISKAVKKNDFLSLESSQPTMDCPL